MKKVILVFATTFVTTIASSINSFGQNSTPTTPKIDCSNDYFVKKGQRYVLGCPNTVDGNGEWVVNSSPITTTNPNTYGISFFTNFEERVRVNNVGNLGIATTNPQERFQIGERFTIHNGGTRFIGDNARSIPGNDVRLVPGGASEIRFEQSGYYSNSGVIRLLAAPFGLAGTSIDYIKHTAVTIGQDARVGIGRRIGSKMESSSTPTANDGISARLHVVCESNGDANLHNDFGVRFENLPKKNGRQLVIDSFGYVYEKARYPWFSTNELKAKTSNEGDELDYLYQEIQQLKNEIEILKKR